MLSRTLESYPFHVRYVIYPRCLRRSRWLISANSAVYIADPDTRETLTSIEANNAMGDSAPGFLILPGEHLLEKYFDNDISDDVAFATNTETGSGVTSDMLALDWLEHWELQQGLEPRQDMALCIQGNTGYWLWMATDLT
jgi:hypothetical protein